MEGQPDTENVVYIDEFPHLAEKVRLRHLGQQSIRHFQLPVVVEIPRQTEPPEPVA